MSRASGPVYRLSWSGSAHGDRWSASETPGPVHEDGAGIPHNARYDSAARAGAPTALADARVDDADRAVPVAGAPALRRHVHRPARVLPAARVPERAGTRARGADRRSRQVPRRRGEPDPLAVRRAAFDLAARRRGSPAPPQAAAPAVSRPAYARVRGAH